MIIIGFSLQFQDIHLLIIYRDGEITFSFMKKSGKKDLFDRSKNNEKIGGLNDAIADENFEMKKKSPMSKFVKL